LTNEKPAARAFVRVLDKGEGKNKEKLIEQGKVSRTKEVRA
jgi:hypothetical protein